MPAATKNRKPRKKPPPGGKETQAPANGGAETLNTEKRTNFLLRVFIETLPHFGICVDEAATVVEVIAGGRKVTTRGLEGRALAEILPESDARELTAALQRTLAAGGGFVFEFVLSVLSGRRWFQVKTALAHLPGEERRTVVFFFHDITNEKLAEGVLTYAQVELEQQREKALEGEEILQAIINRSPFPIFLKDRNGRYTLVNDSLLERHGKTHAEFIGRTAHDLFSKEVADRLEKEERHVLGTGEGLETSFWMPVAGGEKKIVVNTRFPVSRKNGEIVGVGTISRDITDQVRAETRLKESQRLLQTVFDLIPQFLFVRDAESRYLMVNRPLAESHGMEPEDFVGRHLRDLPTGNPMERARYLKADEWVLKHGQRLEEPEVPVTYADGRQRTFSRTSLPLKNDDGEVVGLVGVTEDITEAKAAAEAVRQNEELFRSILDHTPSSIFLKDLDSRYLMVNHTFAEFLGKAPAELIGKTTTELFPSDFAGAYMEQDRVMVETGKAVTRELQTPGKEGLRWFSITKFPVYHPTLQKKVVGAILTDVTEARKASQKLATQEKLLQTVLDTIPHWVYAKDQEGRYIRVNRSMADSFNASPEEFVGRETKDYRLSSPIRIGVEPELDALLGMDREVLSTGKRVQAPEFVLTTASGEERVLNIIKLPLRDSEDHLVGIVGISEEITERKDLERRLLQSQKMEALGTMAGGIAHDFNNILQPIIGFAEILKSKFDPASPEFDEVEVVLTSAHRAKDLVANILLFSRGIPTEKGPCDLRSVAEETLRLLSSTLPKTIHIETDFAPDLDWVDGDPSRLHQVLLNLGLNAWQAMPETGRLGVSLENVQLRERRCFPGITLSGKFVRVALADSGSGMDKETVAHIFDPFFTTKGPGEGTGLGLSTVLGIVQDHGGGIGVTTTPGQGSVFEVFLPVWDHQVENPPPPENVSPAGTEAILFVDDEEQITQLAKKGLEDFGFRVTTVNDGVEAEQVFRENPRGFDLVVTDQQMPHLKGEKLAARLKQARPEIPVILCTGFSDTISPENREAAGIDGFLYKPVALRELGLLIRKLLDEGPEQA